MTNQALTIDTKPSLQVSVSDTMKMLNALQPQGEFTFQTFDDNTDRKKADGGKDLFAKQFHGTFNRHATSLFELNQQGAGVYVTVNQTDGQGRTAKNITGIRAVFVDFDTVNENRLDMLTQLDNTHNLLLPSFIVESSKGKHHAYWIADGIPLDSFTDFQKRLINFFESIGDIPDKGIHDTSRVMRLAGFYHMKVDSKKGLTGEPVLTKVVYPTGADIKRYSFEQIKTMIDSLPALPIGQTSKNEKYTSKQTSTAILNNLPSNRHSLPTNDSVPCLTADKVRSLARGRWQAILSKLGYEVSTDSKQHTQCPICGGNDRFRFDDESGTGSYICSQGNGENIAGDGLSLLIDHAGMSLDSALQAVTGILNGWGLVTAFDSKDSIQPPAWGELLPLSDNVVFDNPYPIHAFSQELQAVIRRTSYYFQTPSSIAGHAVIGALSTMCQPYVNAPFQYSFIPASIFALAELASGGGKTQVNKYIYKVIAEKNRQYYEAYQSKIDEYNSQLSALKGKEKADYIATTPKPKNESFTMSAGTLQFITGKFVIEGALNLSINSGEAGKMLGGYAMSDKNIGETIGTLADLYSGECVEYNTSGNQKETGRTKAFDRRLTIDITGQPIILKDVFSNELMMKQGFLARFLISCEPSLIGKRVFDDMERESQDENLDPALLWFWNRCQDFYDRVPSDNGKNADGTPNRFNMPFAGGAMRYLNQYRQHCENRLNTVFAEYQESAQRMAENASRIATLFAYFDGETSVSIERIEKAILLVEYSMNELLRYNQQSQASVKNNSQKLADYIVRQCKDKGVTRLIYSEVQSKVNVKALRQKSELETHIEVLTAKNYLKVVTVDNVRYIEINPKAIH